MICVGRVLEWNFRLGLNDGNLLCTRRLIADYRMLSVEPLEVWYREKVGTIIAPENLDELPARIDELIVNSDKIEQQIATLRNELFFNIGL